MFPVSIYCGQFLFFISFSILIFWHNIIAWGKTADVIARYVHKGSKLYIEGKIKTRSYDDNQGRKCYVTEIHIDVLELLDPKPAANNQQQQQGYSDPITF